MADWRIITGDCIAEMDGLAPGSARLVFADPPYNIGVDYGAHHNDRMAPEAYLAWCRRWLDAAARVLTPDGSLCLLINWESA
jgi:site-specific DNA-methyltransferase (adenine-specific)